jgi:hypothetical protein
VYRTFSTTANSVSVDFVESLSVRLRAADSSPERPNATGSCSLSTNYLSAPAPSCVTIAIASTWGRNTRLLGQVVVQQKVDEGTSVNVWSNRNRWL